MVGRKRCAVSAVSVMNWSRQITKSSRASAALVAAVSGIWFTKLVCMKSAVVTGGSMARFSAGAIWETGSVRGGAVRAASASNSGLRISRHGQLVRLTPPPGMPTLPDSTPSAPMSWKVW